MKIHQFFPEICRFASCKPTGNPEGFNDSGYCWCKFEFANENQSRRGCVENEPAGIAAWLMISFKMDGTSISEKQSGK